MSPIRGRELTNHNKEFPINILGSGMLNGTLINVNIATFPREEFYYVSDTSTAMMEYSFFHTDPDATTTSTDWIGIKFVYTNTTQLIRRQIKIGAPDNRATLFTITT